MSGADLHHDMGAVIPRGPPMTAQVFAHSTAGQLTLGNPKHEYCEGYSDDHGIFQRLLRYRTLYRRGHNWLPDPSYSY